MISIIVPVYNAAKTIERCVDSIIKQTYIDWELLLINDGSNDNSPVICDRYAKQDSRIRVFHKENGGVSSARNLGLNNVNGDWVTFVDSDDWIKEKYLEHLISHVDDCIDLVISYAYIYNELGKRKECYPSKIVTDDNFESIFIENDMHWHTSPWSNLYRMDIIRKFSLGFCEGMYIGEDALFLYSYLLVSKKFFISSDTDYCYNEISQNSLTKRINKLSSELLSYTKISNIVKSLIKVKKIKSITALNRLEWLIACYQRRVLNSLYHNRVSFYRRLRILKGGQWNYYIKYIKNCSIKEKILIFLLKYKFFILYDFLRLSSMIIKK